MLKCMDNNKKRLKNDLNGMDKNIRFKMGIGLGSRSYYAEWKNILFNFESKHDRDYFVAHAEEVKVIPAKKAYERQDWINRVKLRSSTTGLSKERKERIKNWHGNK